MKGVVLAGGLGTRLKPLTNITNKHLLPVYNTPMIYYPLRSLVDAGIEDIMIVCGGQHAGEFLRLLGNGAEFGLNKIVVFLGDNIIESSIAGAVEEFRNQESGARILLKEVEDPRDYGVVHFAADGSIDRIIEKPTDPPSNFAVVGIYMYPANVFDIIRNLKPSKRHELEITDVNNLYLSRHELKHSILEGWWADAGASIDAYYETIVKVAQSARKKAK